MHNDQAVVWHSLLGNPQIISSDTLEFLKTFDTPRLLESLGEEFGLDDDGLAVVQTLRDASLLVPPEQDERGLIEALAKIREQTIPGGNLLNYLELIVSEKCNFRCTYCIHFNNLEADRKGNGRNGKMDWDTAKRALDWYFTLLPDGREANVNFGGGEPLLNWPLILQSLEYCAKTFPLRKTSFSINTNASLITPEIAQTLRLYRVSIATSLDGIQQGNDKVRLTAGGKGTFLSVVRGFDILAKAGYPIDGFSATVDRRNFGDLNESLIDWAISHGMVEVRIDIDVLDLEGISVDEAVSKILRLRAYGKNKNVDVFGFWSRPFENFNFNPTNEHVAFCGGVRGNSVCINPQGNAFICGYSRTVLGNIKEPQQILAPGSPYATIVASRLVGRPKECAGCPIEGQCAGACEISREFSEAIGRDQNRRCEFYRTMTKKLLEENLDPDR
ncbi:MAG: radical SAM protein [Acidobacteriaceae bacterium]